MEMIDLTHMIKEGMPVYPGTLSPEIKVETTIASEGFEERLITIFSHTGTHMDAPSHILDGRRSLSDFDISDFAGHAVMIDVRGMDTVSASYIRSYEKELRGAHFAVLFSGWSSKWGEQSYFENYPVLEADAAGVLAASGVKGVAVDMISVDPVDTVTFENHKIFLNRNMIIVENLTNLHLLEGKEFVLNCIPLRIEYGDGSPVRAFAMMG
ncbi:cyclase family protein [Denitrovibrio acetiphilus DSM 12809]|uniref:Cyclase family protein n=1 Tax=Denitrovibrio acetiphilus (strain DSM 12809 / NBRC 114555 / N2460) TaxID=522772 RepID=D4H3L4_DENA2|nr:cyclase family protein [Denitrovibrio acetiphilus]ADD69116.1 cyclase family protein [Denitrovibrio acetiphilus DSM 12809]